MWIARAMATTGDWVTPRLYDKPWFEKPILYYWLAAIGFLLRLPAEWAARLPSALAALAAALAIGWLARRQYGHQAHPSSNPALLAPLVFATTVAAIGFARAATADMLFTSFITLAMASAASVLRLKGLLSSHLTKPPAYADTLSLLFFGASLGLAVLAKGPAAIVLAVGSVALWALATKNWRSALGLAHPFALATFCLVALPWYALCAARNPDFLRVFIFEHNFERYLTPVFQHPQPFWFFLPITLIALLPWVVLLWPLAQNGLRLWREKSWRDSPELFFACWAVFPILFFSLSQSKLPGYVLPAIPPLALLCAGALFRGQSAASSARNACAGIGFAISATWLALAVIAAILLHRLPPAQHEALRTPLSFAISMAILGASAIALFARVGGRWAMVAPLAVVTVLVAVANLTILPRLDPFISARWHAQFLQNDRHPDRIFTYHLQRSWSYGLAFYLGRELPEWSAGDPTPALVLTTPAGLSEIRRLHRFYGSLEESYQGILYVPIAPAPR